MFKYLYKLSSKKNNSKTNFIPKGIKIEAESYKMIKGVLQKTNVTTIGGEYR